MYIYKHMCKICIGFYIRTGVVRVHSPQEYEIIAPSGPMRCVLCATHASTMQECLGFLRRGVCDSSLLNNRRGKQFFRMTENILSSRFLDQYF